MKVYPLADIYRGIPSEQRQNLRAISTGEFRPPRKDEWYLSGAIVEAYRAPNDLCASYYIAQIVEVKEVTTTQIVRFLG